MICPRCQTTLKAIVSQGVEIDVCYGGCGGIWFDQLELRKLDEKHEADQNLLQEIQQKQRVKVDESARLKCPKCTDTIMMRHFFSVKREVEVDQCPKCAGFWLDLGELSRIHALFTTEDDRQKAAKDFIEENFGAQMDQIAKEGEEKRAAARETAKALRFLCPSNYIPGKQDWGAF